MLSDLNVINPTASRPNRPIRKQATFLPYGIDLQQLPPLGWCPVCGSEIYAPGENLCTRCVDRHTADTANLDDAYG